MNKSLFTLLTSTAGILATSLSSAAQQPSTPPFQQGYGLTNDQLPAAYNASARIDVQGWDFFFTGSFTYWDVDETGFNLILNETNSPNNLVFQDNNYSPGFKVGIGLDFGGDNWVGFAEYTWLRNHTSTDISATDYTAQSIINNSGATPFDCSRHIGLDMIDLTLSRPFYEGSKLTVSPSSGIRGAWLRQKYRALEVPSSHSFHGNSNSWLIGPRAGVNAHWLIGYGLRLESDVGASILFQQYRATIRPGSALYGFDHQNHLASVADLAIGLGWGTYLNCQKSHLDLVATYDFMNWWGQNFIRGLADSFDKDIGAQAGGLKISGLTFTGRFDF